MFAAFATPPPDTNNTQDSLNIHDNLNILHQNGLDTPLPIDADDGKTFRACPTPFRGHL
jgi:hypothetical protein